MANATVVAGGKRRRLRTITLRQGGRLAAAFLELLALADSLLQQNAGVPLLPQRTFPAADEAGTVTVVTDASGDDGVGGYAVCPDHPGWVGVVFEEWPSDVAAALKQAARKRCEREAGAPMLAMPAAELFGSIAVAAAAARQWPEAARRFIAVGDCAAAAAVLTAATSRAEQMRALVMSAHALSQQWLGVAVPREANQDPDLLSHPERGEEVMRSARSAFERVEQWRLEHSDWELLRSVLALDLGTTVGPHAGVDDLSAPH